MLSTMIYKSYIVYLYMCFSICSQGRPCQERLHSLLVQSDIVCTHKRMLDRVAEMSTDLQKCSSRHCKEQGSSVR